MGKKSESRIVIDLLQRHAEVPSPEAFRDRYVSQYAGRPLGRPAFVAPEPGPELEPEPVPTLPDLGGEPVAEATTLIDAFQDDFAALPGDAGVVEPAVVDDAMPPEEAPEPPPDAEAVEAAFGDPFAGGDVNEVVAEEAHEGATRLIDSLDEPADPFSSPEEPPSGSETTSFEAVDAGPEDVWGAPAEPAPTTEARHGTVVMGALPDPDAEDGNEDASKEASSQGGKKKKKRRHR